MWSDDSFSLQELQDYTSLSQACCKLGLACDNYAILQFGI